MIPDKNLNPKDSQYKKNKTKTLQDAMKKAEDAVNQLRSSNTDDSIKSDVLGSYTGMFYDGDEPDQDADDL